MQIFWNDVKKEGMMRHLERNVLSRCWKKRSMLGKQAHIARTRDSVVNQRSLNGSRRVLSYEERSRANIPKLRLRRAFTGQLVGSSTVIRVFHSRMRAPIFSTRRRIVCMLARLNGVC